MTVLAASSLSELQIIGIVLIVAGIGIGLLLHQQLGIFTALVGVVLLVVGVLD